MSKKRVVITGIGVVSPIGIGKEEYWKALTEGKSGIKRITLFDASEFPTQIAGEVRDFHPEEFMDTETHKYLSRSSQFSLASAKMAIKDAFLDTVTLSPQDIGVAIGTSTNAMDIIESQIKKADSHGISRMNPFAIATSIPNSITSDVATELGIKGPLMTISTGCVAGLDAIAHGYKEILKGSAPIFICGGVDCSLTYYSFMGFCAARIMSTLNHHPEKACRPFDLKRSGGVLSEGAGMVILEDYDFASERGAKIYGEIVGYGNNGEGGNIVSRGLNEKGMVTAMKSAMYNAKVSPEDINYISAHAPSDIFLDYIETLAIKEVFGDLAYRLPVSSIKSMIGNPLAAAGPMQVIAAALSLTKGIIPPTINYEYPDPKCDLDVVPNLPRQNAVETCMINAHAFGGNDSVLIIKKGESK